MSDQYVKKNDLKQLIDKYDDLLLTVYNQGEKKGNEHRVPSPPTRDFMKEVRTTLKEHGDDLKEHGVILARMDEQLKNLPVIFDQTIAKHNEIQDQKNSETYATKEYVKEAVGFVTTLKNRTLWYVLTVVIGVSSVAFVILVATGHLQI